MKNLTACLCEYSMMFLNGVCEMLKELYQFVSKSLSMGVPVRSLCCLHKVVSCSLAEWCSSFSQPAAPIVVWLILPHSILHLHHMLEDKVYNCVKQGFS